MDKLADILIMRDGVSREEAMKMIEETRKLILNYPDDADWILLEQLGLEPDYLDILFV